MKVGVGLLSREALIDGLGHVDAAKEMFRAVMVEAFLRASVGFR